MNIFKKMPEGNPEKQPPVKNVLLQTYFTSLLSLVLCTTMFLGTTYAWFTSEVNNINNEIYIGTLDVGLFKHDGLNGEGKVKWADLASSDTNNTKLFDGGIRWEPGYTALETIKVANEGDLAFKYVLNFTDGTSVEETNPINETDAIPADAAKCFEVWVYDHRANEGKENVSPKPNSYAALTAENSGWVCAGSLDELLAGKSVLGGVMNVVRDEDPTTPTNDGTTDGVATENTYTIALHMRENATSAVMGQRIKLNVKLVAYQMVAEQDSFNEQWQYDQMVATEEQLREALENGGMVALASDIDLARGVTIPADKTVVLDLNGHKITGAASVEMTTLITNKGNLTIVGTGDVAISHDGVAVGDRAINAISNYGILTVNGGKISNTGTGAPQIGYAIDNYPGATLTINDGEIIASGSSYYDGIRLFCSTNGEILVVVNGGTISTIWAQNPSTGKSAPVKGTVVINGVNEINKVYFENHTEVKLVKTLHDAAIEDEIVPYGGDNPQKVRSEEGDYFVYRFPQTGN